MTSLKLITFDVTGTLLKFRKPPVQQYVDFGRKYGVTVDEERIKLAFKQQWKEMNEKNPNFGTCWRSWWTEFVVNTFQDSDPKGPGANEGTLHTIATELIEHFTTSKCWEVKEGAFDLLLAMKQLGSCTPATTASSSAAAAADYVPNNSNNNSEKKFKSVGVCTSTTTTTTATIEQTTRRGMTAMQIGVVSNFDSRLEQILRATQLHHYFDFFATSHECQVSKPHQGIFKAALEAATKNQPSQCPAIQPAQALHIGDSYNLDFVGAVNAGWNAILVMSPDQQIKEQLPQNIQNANPPVVFSDLIQLRSHLVNKKVNGNNF